VSRHNTTYLLIPDCINTIGRTVNTLYHCFGELGGYIDPVSYDVIEAIYTLNELKIYIEIKNKSIPIMAEIVLESENIIEIKYKSIPVIPESVLELENIIKIKN